MFTFNESLLNIEFDNFDTKFSFDNQNDLIYLVYIKKCIELRTIFNPNLTEKDFENKVFESKPIELKHFKKGFKLANKTKDLEFFMNGILNDYINNKNDFKKILLELFKAFKTLNNKAIEESKFNIETKRLDSLIVEYSNYFNNTKKVETTIETSIEIIEQVETTIEEVEELKIENIFENLVKKK